MILGNILIGRCKGLWTDKKQPLCNKIFWYWKDGELKRWYILSLLCIFKNPPKERNKSMKSNTENLTPLIWLFTIILIVASFAYFFNGYYAAALFTWIITIGFIDKLKRSK